MSTAITDSIAVDPPLTSAQAAVFTPAQRQYIDAQIRGCQQHLVDSLLSGVVCTWVDLDAGSAAVTKGQCGCSALDASNPRKVTKVTPSAIAAAGGACCVFLSAASPGSRVRAAIAGRLPPSVTGLPASAGTAIVNPNWATIDADLTGCVMPTEYPIGTIDSAGVLTLNLPQEIGAGSGNAKYIRGAAVGSLASALSGWMLALDGDLEWATVRGLTVVANGTCTSSSSCTPVEVAGIDAGDMVLFSINTINEPGDFTGVYPSHQVVADDGLFNLYDPSPPATVTWNYIVVRPGALPPA